MFKYVLSFGNGEAMSANLLVTFSYAFCTIP